MSAETARRERDGRSQRGAVGPRSPGRVGQAWPGDAPTRVRRRLLCRGLREEHCRQRERQGCGPEASAELQRRGGGSTEGWCAGPEQAALGTLALSGWEGKLLGFGKIRLRGPLGGGVAVQLSDAGVWSGGK